MHYYKYVLTEYIRTTVFSVDCWDGAKGEPVIYHGHTLTSQIMFKDAVEACRDYGFKNSDYPVILSLENHCSLEQQDRMADHLTSILGELLYIYDTEETIHLPSPEALKQKILIKAKKLTSDASEDRDDVEADSEDIERKEARKEKPKKLSKKLSSLVSLPSVHLKVPDNQQDTEERRRLPSPGSLKRKTIIKTKKLASDSTEDLLDDIESDAEVKKEKPPKLSKKLSDLVSLQAVHFEGFDNAKAKYFHMSSFGEAKAKTFIREAGNIN